MKYMADLGFGFMASINIMDLSDIILQKVI